jgi:hypothetical protein
MIAPGAYAILAPLFVGFLVGPRCLFGALVGSIASGCMVAIMMSNAGGAWDNGKKLCEKLGIKKTEQGKACIVGDTVGDPFKDTSGPALNILLKLMSMVSLTVAPLMRVKEDDVPVLVKDIDWRKWYYGIVPLAIFVIITYMLVNRKILTWDDPLGDLLEGGEETSSKSTPGVKTPVFVKLESMHEQNHDAHVTNVIPDKIDKATAKRLSGHLFNEDKFNSAQDDEGFITREDFLNRVHE